MKRIPQGVRETQILEVANKNGHIFKGFNDVYVNKESRITMSCPTHGEWNTTIANYIRNGNCRQCQIQSRRDNGITEKIKDCLPPHVSFVSFVDGYTNQRSKVIIKCDIHGESTKSVTDIVNKNSFCKNCGFESTRLKRKLNINDVESRVIDKCQIKGYEYRGLVDGYTNNQSSIILRCPSHGEWVTTFQTFMKSKHGCPNCRNHGYKTGTDGFLYILRSTCGQLMKIGITNNLDVRLSELKWYTPFEFNVIETMKSTAESVQVIEKGLHSIYVPAGMRGFNGATEWFKWDSSVINMMR